MTPSYVDYLDFLDLLDPVAPPLDPLNIYIPYACHIELPYTPPSPLDIPTINKFK